MRNNQTERGLSHQGYSLPMSTKGAIEPLRWVEAGGGAIILRIMVHGDLFF